jgi:hypothetical protein
VGPDRRNDRVTGRAQVLAVEGRFRPQRLRDSPRASIMVRW